MKVSNITDLRVLDRLAAEAREFYVAADEHGLDWIYSEDGNTVMPLHLYSPTQSNEQCGALQDEFKIDVFFNESTGEVDAYMPVKV